MKKLFAIVAMAAVTMSFMSCQKDDNKDNNKDDDSGKVVRTHRVKTMGDSWSDPYTFSYDASGRVSSIVSKSDNRVFEYNGNTLVIKDNGTVEYTMTLNSDGFATKVVSADHTWDITYDANGYMIEGKKDGVKCTSQSIEDGNILYWTRYDKDNDFWRMKDATFYTDKVNTGCIQTHYAEDLGFKRWAWEARLFGYASVNLMESCRWHNYGDELAAKTAVYIYEYDADGMVKKETKYYGVWNESDTQGMDEDTVTEFTWEKIQ